MPIHPDIYRQFGIIPRRERPGHLRAVPDPTPLGEVVDDAPAVDVEPYVPPTRVPQPVVIQAHPGTALMLALDGAASDAERADIIANASEAAREQLPGALAYRRLTARDTVADAFIAAMEATEDDTTRAQLLALATPAQRAALVDNLRLSRLSLDELTKRYVSLVEVE